jgi:glycerol-3-phosphate dehydrogenase (NAD(P)+)
MKKIAVLEPGAWGTVLGILLSKENQVNFWYEDSVLAGKIDKSRENERLPGIKIPKKIFISPDLEKIIENTDLFIIASPSFNFRKTLLKLKKCRGQTSANYPPLLGIAKGIEKETLKLPSQIVEEILRDRRGTVPPYAHLSGPGFAREIIRGKPAEEVIASQNRSLLKKLKELFKIKPLKISTTTDLIGVQLAGALKNALAIGISLVEAGVRNPRVEKIKKDLIQLGLEEMVKIGKVMGAKRETFLGPAGKGDLILTSTSPLSRNFQFGKNLYCDAEKMRANIKERKITVEGFETTFVLYKLGQKYKLNLPIINEIYKVIYKKTSPEKTIKNLIKLVS